MSPHNRPKRMFTVEQANATLPLVKAITGDLVQLSRDVIERRQRLEQFRSAERDMESADPYDAELSQFEAELERDSQQLQEYARELAELGVELKSAPDGLVDFPSEMDGRVVYLCWKYGEAEVTHWHELDGGFSGRQPLVAGSVANGVGDGIGDDAGDPGSGFDL